MAITSRPLLAVDGDSFAHRAYHALPKSIRRRGNQGGGAIVGFANLLLRLYEDEQPRAVLVGWDTLDAPTYRHDALAGYQGGRRFDAELIDQLEMLPQFVAACGFACAKAAGYEADDFLAAAVADEEGRGGTVLVASGDRDAFQLASDKTTILQPVRAGEMARIGPAGVLERYGVEPGQVPDFIALRGDPSDKLPGAKGVGPKGAAKLLRQHGTLEQALEAGELAVQADELRLYRRIATMDGAAPLPPLPDQTPTWTTAADLARSWELNRLAERLAALAQSARERSCGSDQARLGRVGRCDRSRRKESCWRHWECSQGTSATSSLSKRSRCPTAARPVRPAPLAREERLQMTFHQGEATPSIPSSSDFTAPCNEYHIGAIQTLREARP